MVLSDKHYAFEYIAPDFCIVFSTEWKCQITVRYQKPDFLKKKQHKRLALFYYYFFFVPKWHLGFGVILAQCVGLSAELTARIPEKRLLFLWS